MVTPEVTEALAEATDVVGYIPYVARVAPREGLTLHPSDNRVELDRARAALEMAAAGQAGRRRLLRRSRASSPWPRAVFEALEGRPDWQALDIRVLPGITAMLAAAAAAGAPLGHDFCCINLSRQPEALGGDRDAASATLRGPISRWPSTTRARPAAPRASPRRWTSCAKNAGRTA